MTDEKKPDSRNRRSAREEAAFKDYCMMGVQRSLVKLATYYKEQANADPLAKSAKPMATMNTLVSWSQKFDWQVRVKAWDKEQADAAEKRWQDRYDAVREADYKAGEKLREIAEKLIEAAPNFIRTKKKTIKSDDPEMPDKEIHTLAMDPHALMTLLDLSSKLQRQSVDAVTKLDVTSGGKPINSAVSIIEVRKDYGKDQKPDNAE